MGAAAAGARSAVCSGEGAAVRTPTCRKGRSVGTGRSRLFGRRGEETQVLTALGAQRRLARKEPLPGRDAAATARCEAGLFASLLRCL